MGHLLRKTTLVSRVLVWPVNGFKRLSGQGLEGGGTENSITGKNSDRNVTEDKVHKKGIIRLQQIVTLWDEG